MSEEEIIETLKEFEKNRVEQLKEPAKNLFYAIMKIADERDKYEKKLDKIKEIMNTTPDTNYSYDYVILKNEIYKVLEEIE